MITLSQTFRPHPDVIDTELDAKEAVLLHMTSMEYYSLNLTGTRIWQGLKQGLTLAAISQRLQADFDVTAERAEHSVLELVTSLSQQQLVKPWT